MLLTTNMDIVMTAVTTVGFPIVMCIILMWYIKDTNDKTHKQIEELNDRYFSQIETITNKHQEETNTFRDAIDRNTEASIKMTSLLDAFLKEGN